MMENENSFEDKLDALVVAEGITVDKEAVVTAVATRKVDKYGIAIKALSVIGGSLAAGTFLAFFVLSNYEGAWPLVLGLVLIVAGMFIDSVKNKIISVSGVSVYAIGLSAFVYGLVEFRMEEETVYLVVLIMAVCSLVLTKNSVMAFALGLLINFCVFSLCMELIRGAGAGLQIFTFFAGVVSFLLMFTESRLVTSLRKKNWLFLPLRSAFVISYIIGVFYVSFHTFFKVKYPWISVFMPVLVSAVGLWMATRRLQTDMWVKVLIALLTLLPLGLTATFPAIAGCFAVLLFSYMTGYRTGIVLGVGGLLYAIWWYYYDMSVTLLAKSISLFVSGLVFLALYYLASKKLFGNGKN
ncbi:hypothetical protein FUAX_13390 [Fulvitalea axinellae]|uniref:DUF4401 domain-containing protein n=1 Tax=Fulvitalea axinellae TaxID=1182444 RepID=A0AAU9CLU8_9BACT|nr:hypothetical protein FUAX_13390 [Fulvitalea axinellae]